MPTTIPGPWMVVAHSMGWVLYAVTPAVSSSLTIPRLEDVSTEDLIRLTEIEQKILPSSRKPLKLKFVELNKPVNAFDPLSSAWAAMWLLNPWQPFWSGYMQPVNTSSHPDQASTFFMHQHYQQCTLLQNSLPSII